MMDSKSWHSKDPADVLRELGSSPDGLSGSEAKSRLDRLGANELKELARETPLQMFLAQFKNVLVIVLVLASLISASLGFFQNSMDEIMESLAIFVVVFFIAVVGFLQEYRAEKELDALRKMVSMEALVIRDGRRTKVPARDLVSGDVVFLEAGDRIPADCRLLDAIDFQVDESALTGESVPVNKTPAVVAQETSLPERRNMVYAGTHATYGKAGGAVVATGMSTELGKIAEEIQIMEREKTPLQIKLDAVGRQIGFIVMVLCILMIASGLLQEKRLDLDYVTYMGMMAIALAVAAVPEGLPAVVTVTLAKGMRDMVKRNAIVKKLAAVETLGATTVICSDKTGTLTRNEMTVRKMYLDKEVIEVSGQGYEPVGEFSAQGGRFVEQSDASLKLLLSASALCNNASLEREGEAWKITGDPTEAALLVAASKAGLYGHRLAREYPRITEVTFSSERKRMSTIHATPEGGRVIYVKGAPDVILELCSHIITGGTVARMTVQDKKDVMAFNDVFAKDSLRVLGFAFRNLKDTKEAGADAERDLVFIGLMGMMDPPRPDAINAVNVARDAGIRPVIITGDYQLTAVAVAREMGMYSEGDRVLTGAELERLSDEEYDGIVEQVGVYARVSPEHKLKIVAALKRRGHIVAMTGDGVNDAPALKKADIGIAMGITGTDVSKEAADVILVDDNFASIVAAVEEGRGIYGNIKLFIRYLLSCNIGEVLVLFVGMLVLNRIILSPLQVLWMNLLTDAAPALALAWNPVDRDVMKQRPRDPRESIINGSTVTSFLAAGFIMAAGTLYVFDYALTHDARKAGTMAFTAIILFQMFYALSCRSERFPVYKAGFFPNRYLVYAVLLSVSMQVLVIYLPALQDIFNTVPLDLHDWGMLIGISSTAFILPEIWKTIKSRRTAQ